MLLSDKLVRQGDFLFRWRSYMPLLLLIPGILAFKESAQMLESNGEETIHNAFTLIGLFVSFLGLFIRWITIGFAAEGTSGRNTKKQRADELNTLDIYSTVRNPLYLGNFLTIIGVLIATKVWWMMTIGGLAYWIYIERVIAVEEAYLKEKFGKTYINWCNKTPVFLPNLKLWQRSNRNFSIKTILRREIYGVMGVCSAFFIYEFLIDVFFERESILMWVYEDWQWTFGMIIGAFAFFTLRFIKKHTNLLKA